LKSIPRTMHDGGRGQADEGVMSLEMAILMLTGR